MFHVFPLQSVFGQCSQIITSLAGIIGGVVLLLIISKSTSQHHHHSTAWPLNYTIKSKAANHIELNLPWNDIHKPVFLACEL